MNPPQANAPPPDPLARRFGARAVEPEEKTRLVAGVFRSVAGRYDLMNDLMSGGLHRLWKARLIAAMRPRPDRLLLDVAGGTGDVARGWLKAAGSAGSAVLCDINPAMIRAGRPRLIEAGQLGQLRLVCGSAEALPLPDRSVDVYAIAFGLRNVTHIDTALGEARRVLRPGGRFFCLEFSDVVLPVLDRLYRLYGDVVIPRLGAWVAGDAESYRYLIESIRQFPPAPALAERMAEAGLEAVRFTRMTGGITALHRALRT